MTTSDSLQSSGGNRRICKEDTMFPQFVPTEWSTVEEKERFARQFVKFVNSDFSSTCFPKWFYRRLSQMFGFPAFYNRDGFYNRLFTSPDRLVDFLDQVLNHPCYGSWSDAEKALQDWLREERVRERMYERCQQAIRARTRLLTEYGGQP